MQTSVTWNHSLTSPDADGIAWVSAAGPEGSVAVGGGGWASIGVTGSDDVPFLPIVATRPEPTPGYENTWNFGVLVPASVGAVVKIHCFVVCLEDLPE